MLVEKFLNILNDKLQLNFFAGVPDSQLGSLCNYLINTYGICNKHIIAANEGNAAAIATGYHLSTGNVPCVYLQNSGLGNIINPVASLLNDNLYGIPCVFIVGWRGEPNVKDEPQHVFQGQITLKLLEDLNIEYIVIDKDTTEESLVTTVKNFSDVLKAGKSVAFVIKKDGLSYEGKSKYKNDNLLKREEIIETIVNKYKDDLFVSTTGKTSRELFEIREKQNQAHTNDFLTVGSMGHSSSIALGIALNTPNKRVWCIDGDGAVLMHLGSMPVIASQSPKNYVHVVINNSSHESVGGQPTVAKDIDFVKIALACGYKYAYSIEKLEQLNNILDEIEKKEGTTFLEIKSAIGSRSDLGRPTTTPIENKNAFMKYIKEGV
jgi:phosphonopyruvate decarboxylase